MSTVIVDLAEVAARLSARSGTRAEANVQSDLRMLLLSAGLNLREGDLEDVVLEAPVGKRRRIDVEVGATVFEVKKDLRTGNVRDDAVEQLAGYVRDRVAQTGARYVGVLTDGVEWHLYHLDGTALRLVSSYQLDGPADLDGLLLWLDGVLATADHVIPTPAEVTRRLGAKSPAFALDIADLAALYERNADHPGVVMKRSLWAKLLTTALGTAFVDEDRLFIEHTLLVVTAEVIGHAVVGFDVADASIGATTLVRGQLFSSAQIRGVVEEDFFDWVVEVDDGAAFVNTLARRLARFAWGEVEHDVMKVLYESIIAASTRKSLGEYYTPDWLAEAIVDDAVTDPLTQRVLDPSCGSGTFVFHAVRRYLTAADTAGLDLATALRGVTAHVYGVDVHPVAVTLARVTYLLAIGRDRLISDDRPAITIPVYLGDTVQWGQNPTLLDSDALVVPTTSGATLFSDELRFPDRVVEDAALFDGLVSELADAAARPGRPDAKHVLATAFRRYPVRPEDQAMVAETYTVLCRLHDDQQNHIWSYYLRNLARPLWLARPANHVDVLVGNPPWLSYRYMPAAMKTDFRDMSTARGFWAGAAVATNQDLSALFVARAVELYLKRGGTFAFVMPLAVLSRNQYAGFRTGNWTGYRATATSGGHGADTHAAFTTPWDVHAVKPSFFPVPAAVLRGTRADTPTALPGAAEHWTGRVKGRNPSLEAVADSLTRRELEPRETGGTVSPYAPRFAQGATLVPRYMVLLEDAAAGPLGAGANRRSVRSRRSNNEKPPWKTQTDLSGNIERQFIHPVYVGDSVLPFRTRPAIPGLIPWDGTTLSATVSSALDQYPGLAAWWREAEARWNADRTSSLSLLDRLDYQGGLRKQLPGLEHRVVYGASGMYIAAAYVQDPQAVIEHQLYWAAVSGPDEAHYLLAVLNSDALLQLVQPLQARGEHNPRHFDKYVWRMPIPLFDPSEDLHRELAALAVRAASVAADVELTAQTFQVLRRNIRRALVDDGVAADLDKAVTDLLT
ncbi:N-6 DNA methylase [Amnibacterium endophyticum]|uniref:N-6 DNA methylase n=1 Tax=Amnibacterium endophyticum TaxID=2109337 RepID=A0ABW4LGI7_9MICO